MPAASLRRILGAMGPVRPAFVVLLALLAAACARPKAAPDPAPPPPASPAEPQPTPSPAAPEPAAATTPDGVPTRPERTLYRSELSRATGGGRPAYLLRQLGPEPHRPTGRFQGWRITRIFPDDPSLCGSGCDLRVGDVIVAVDGSPLERPEQLTTLLGRLDKLEMLVVHRIRGGALERIEYRIQDP